MRITWYEQSQAAVPAREAWLSEWERMHVARLHVPKRRADWLLGRWTAKLALAETLGLRGSLETLARIEIWPALSGAPQAFVDGDSAALTLSISHADGHAACLVGPPAVAVGCDIEVVEPRSDAFTADYFTQEEQQSLRQVPERRRPEWIAAIWSAKESVLKALSVGLRADTRCLAITLNDQREALLNEIQVQAPYNREAIEWRAFSVRHERSFLRTGLWAQSGNLVRTLVCLPSSCLLAFDR